MIKNLFSLRVISLAAILSNLTFSGGGITLLPEASAQYRPNANPNERDYFCEGGKKINGFPYGLFDWDEVPWGMPGEEFLRLFEGQIRECVWKAWSSQRGISTQHLSPDGRLADNVEFDFEGENGTLSKIKLDNVSSEVRDFLVQRYGLPDRAEVRSRPIRVGCVQDGIGCRSVYEYQGEYLKSGTWRFSETRILLSSPNYLILEPTEPSLCSQKQPSCERFIVFKLCD